MKKSPIPMILCAVLGATTVFGQAQNTPAIQLYEQDVATYTPENVYNPEWETTPIENVAWRKRVSRTIELTQEKNALLTLTSVHPSIGDVLLNGLYNGEYLSHHIFKDERLVDLFTPEMVESLKSSGVTGKQITSLKIRETWLYLIKEKKMVVHISAIAPVVKHSDNTEETLFWVFYPDTRSFLTKQLVAAPGTMPSNLDEVFEGRFFTSKIDKVDSEIIAPKTGGTKW